LRTAWEILTAGPADAAHGVLLLPGGAMAARSYNRVMAEPALAGARLVATTLPGMAGAPITGDITIPALARHAADLAAAHRCDVVVGFSIGATIALEMVLSASFSGPVVLLGPSLTTADEDPFFRAVVRTAQKLGPWPMAALFRLLPHVAKSKDIPDEHKQILLTDIKSNRARDAVRASAAYLDYIGADYEPAERLVASRIPAWVVHAEKGDGGLTEAERATLAAAPLVTVVTIPGAVFFLPDEAPRQIAEVTAAALRQASRS
jgi:pimeloyl-ACP methyl ester carboxylesterase